MLTWITILIFAVAAVIGLTMALAAFRGSFPPVASAVLHGAFAATGLVLLIVLVAGGAAAGARWALVLFLIAALGGFTIALGFHARRKALPKPFVAVHALIAVIGFLILLATALGLM
ncbi:MAG TPA: hypothetical protein VEU54_02405 [Steroidobacteraceae bacterium]|jgi:hypothetical protein|nr:hypothetical protein [Steroidobacteraceae bacterium]